MIDRLTPREQQIAALVMQSNKAIAAALGITPNTVKVHISHAFNKAGVRNRVELALLMRNREGKSS